MRPSADVAVLGDDPELRRLRTALEAASVRWKHADRDLARIEREATRARDAARRDLDAIRAELPRATVLAGIAPTRRARRSAVYKAIARLEDLAEHLDRIASAERRYSDAQRLLREVKRKREAVA